MEFEFRQYQEDAENALLKSLYYDKRSHPVIAVPTGGGKTKIISSFIYKYLEWRSFHNVLVISHTETIVKQDYEALSRFFPGINIGLYSSGLGSKTIEKITVAGIQSIYRYPEKFQHIDLIVIDECHTVPPKGNGMYRQFLDSVKCTRVGMSATVFRAGSGYVHMGKKALFNRLVFDLCEMNKFNELVESGYLSKLYSKPPKELMDVDGVRETSGDFNLKDLSLKLNREEITKAALNELVIFGKNYKSWLVFAINIDHANNIHEGLLRKGIKAEVLHSKNSKDRHKLSERFKRGEFKALVSVGMITTGFDAPNIDLIALLRPTKSPVLHVQMIGRGLRTDKKSGKTHCLVLDFAGNISRLGPINDVQVPVKGKKGKGNGKPIVKECPTCGCLHHPTVKTCIVCGHTFVFKEKISPVSGTHEVVINSKIKWANVTEVNYLLHKKKDRPNSMRVQYSCGMFTISEYICYDHEGYAKHKANTWVDRRWTLSKPPPDVYNLLKYSKYLKKPKKLCIDTSGKYPNILKMILD